MILSDLQILSEIEKGNINIDPFNRECLGSNSYDLHLSKHLACYKSISGEIGAGCDILDAKKHNEIDHFDIPDEGIVLYPGTLYLGSTVEFTETLNAVPCLEGKSSTARLGIIVHLTAGKGDIGFKGYWTLEIMVLHPIRVYANMPICQIFYHIAGDTENPYDKKEDAKYINNDPKPKESMMFKNFHGDKWK